jgi:DNA-directed RNA polymerase specialized sigma24 family protein
MSSGYVIPVDPAELANRFAAPDPTPIEERERREREEDDAEIEALFSSEDYETVVLPLLDRIPDREADLIYLYYGCGKRQADIAEIFDVTQAAISYRLDRGIQRMKFLLSIPTVTEEDMREDLVEIFEQIDINILVGMWQTTCQSEVASKLKLTQGRVRHRFFKAVEVLKGAAERDKKFYPYHKIFSSISSKNFNILRAVQLPQWSNRGVDRCI